MTEWQMLVSVLNIVYFSRNFKTCGLFCFLSILLGGAPEAPIQSLEAKGYSTGVIDPKPSRSHRVFLPFSQTFIEVFPHRAANSTAVKAKPVFTRC